MQATMHVRLMRELDLAVLQDAAVAQRQHVRGIFVELGQDVRGHQQGHAVGLQLAEQLGQAGARFGIEAGGGFVQQQHLGLVDDGLADGDALAQAARQAAAGLLQAVAQVEPLRGAFDRGGDVGFRQALRGGGIFQAACHREVLVEAEEIREVAHDAVHVARPVADIHVGDRDGARERRLQPGDAAHQRGLARAVGADQRGDAAVGDGQRDVVERAMAGVVEGEIGYFDHVLEIRIWS